MAKSNRHLSRRSKVKSKIQYVYSEKRMIFVEKYLTPKGKRLLKEGVITRYKANKLYSKNRYKINENAKIIKSIYHAT